MCAPQVHHLGMYHDSLTDCCVLYYNRLPSEVDADVAIVLEPVIGSGAGARSAFVCVYVRVYMCVRTCALLSPFCACVLPGTTIESVIYILKQWGVKKIKVMSVVATEFGMMNLASSNP